MTDSSARLVITADMAQLLSEQEKVLAKQVAIQKKVAETGESWQKVGGQVAAAALPALSFTAIMSQGVKVLGELNSEYDKLSKSKGGTALDVAKAIDQFGFDKNTSSALRTQSRNTAGGATESERAGAIGALSEWKRTSRWTIPKETVSQFIALSASGLYSTEALIKLIKNGKPLPTLDEQAEKLSRLGGAAQTEYALRTVEYGEHWRAETSSAGQQGFVSARIGNAALENYKLNHPYRQSFLPDSVLASGLGAPDTTLPEGRNAVANFENTLQEIRNHLAAANKPKLNLSGQDGKTH